MQPRWEAIREQLLKFKKYIFYGPAFLVSALEKHSHLCTRRLMQDVIFKKKITKLSPDDWVFALKDIKDLAGAFLPAGINTNNNIWRYF